MTDSVAGATADQAYLWCPAYPLPNALAVAEARAAAEIFTTALHLTLRGSPLLDRHPGPGAWLSAAERITDLPTDCAWLLAARGGYGCLDLLDTWAAWSTANPTARVIGYSDLTILHAAQAVLGAPGGLYGFMPGVRHGLRARSSAIALARGEALTVSDLAGAHVLHAGNAEGPLFAGCLRVLTGLCGTPWMPKLAGCILALEDLDERPYRIDRDLQQLHASGALTGIQGLVFGTFPSELPAAYAGPSTSDICRAWAARLNVPAVFGVPFGHDADPLTLGIGRLTRLLAGTCEPDSWALTQTSTLCTLPR